MDNDLRCIHKSLAYLAAIHCARLSGREPAEKWQKSSKNETGLIGAEKFDCTDQLRFV